MYRIFKNFIITLVAVVALGAATTATAHEGEHNEAGQHYGAIQSLPGTTGEIGTWVVRGRDVHVTDLTEISVKVGTPFLGQYVLVLGTINSDNSVNADLI